MDPVPPSRFVYGPGLPDEAQLRLLGDPQGQRILDLGCGSGHNALALALAGAKVIAVEPDADRADLARERANRSDQRLEVHVAELHELAFLRADSIDAAYSVFALQRTGDLGRMLRQVHRVLKPEAALVLSVAHPAARAQLDHTGKLDANRGVHRSWFDPSPQQAPGELVDPVEAVDSAVIEHPRSLADLFLNLTRANFRVDTVLEADSAPEAPLAAPPELLGWVPATLLLRARKTGT
jgi:SAM-dependent methyltransferase